MYAERRTRKDQEGSGETDQKGRIIPGQFEKSGKNVPRRKDRRPKKKAAIHIRYQKKAYEQIPIPFPADGIIGTTGKSEGNGCGREARDTCGIGMGTCNAAIGEDEAGEERIATADQRIDQTT